MIRFENVTKKYKNHFALEQVNLEIKAGDFISVVGQSGAGKSTLLKLIFAEERHDGGKIFIDGVDLTTVPDKEIPFLRRKIGVVFQDIKLLPRKTAFENVAFAMEVGGYPREQIMNDVPKILEIVDLIKKMDSFPDEMSGGERQRVAIARALAHKPLLLIADEPTGNLDEINSKEIMDLLLKINSYGTTVILATHAKDLVNKIQRRVITIEHGKLIYDQPKQGSYKL
jgi:cell division transport system ATP-binding protein